MKKYKKQITIRKDRFCHKSNNLEINIRTSPNYSLDISELSIGDLKRIKKAISKYLRENNETKDLQP